MWSFSRVYLVFLLVGAILSSSSNAQPTVDDSSSCQSSTSDEAVRVIRKELQDVKKLLGSVLNLLGSNQQQNNASCVSKEDFENLKTACTQQTTLSNCTPVLIQQNVDGSNFFNRSWTEFKVGFGSSSGNFWLGNERLSQLTQQGRYKLRFELQEIVTNHWYWAEYSTFIVKDETYNYRLNVSGYDSNTGFDAFGYSSGMMFTTYDRDNDRRGSTNCAAYNGGGFWYKNCAYCGVNAARGSFDDFDWKNIKLQTSRMWLKCL